MEEEDNEKSFFASLSRRNPDFTREVNEHPSNNASFLRAVLSYKESFDKCPAVPNQYEMSKEIVEKYILPSSSHEIHLGEDVRLKLTKFVDSFEVFCSLLQTDCERMEIFEDAYDEIESVFWSNFRGRTS